MIWAAFAFGWLGGGVVILGFINAKRRYMLLGVVMIMVAVQIIKAQP